MIYLFCTGWAFTYAFCYSKLPNYFQKKRECHYWRGLQYNVKTFSWPEGQWDAWKNECYSVFRRMRSTSFAAPSTAHDESNNDTAQTNHAENKEKSPDQTSKVPSISKLIFAMPYYISASVWLIFFNRTIFDAREQSNLLLFILSINDFCSRPERRNWFRPQQTPNNLHTYFNTHSQDIWSVVPHKVGNPSFVFTSSQIGIIVFVQYSIMTSIKVVIGLHAQHLQT